MVSETADVNILQQPALSAAKMSDLYHEVYVIVPFREAVCNDSALQ